MNYINSEVQEKQQNGLLAAMFGNSRNKGLDIPISFIVVK